MKKIIGILIICVIATVSSYGQAGSGWIQGEISFVTKKNVYVKFSGTESIHTGDSLYVKMNDRFQPALTVVKKSSVSILCTPLQGEKFSFKKGQTVFAKAKKTEIADENKNFEKKKVEKERVIAEKKQKTKLKPVRTKSKISGKISFAGNSNLADLQDKTGNHRLRYIFAMKGTEVAHSNFYFDNYIAFNQTLEYDFSRSGDIEDKLRVYRVYGGYKNDKFDISLGRQIKNKISALGSFDGLYLERKVKNNFYSGIIVGTRPDYSDFGFNSSLFQYGIFMSFSPENRKNTTKSTIAFFEQKNNGYVDRRFVYVQFSTALSKKIRFFGASEIDLYRIVEGKAAGDPKLTNIYGNITFKVNKRLNFGIGLDSRKNRIYYETYKDYLQTLIERETRQGLRLRARYKPFKKISVSLMSNFRFEEKNLYSSYYNVMIYTRRLPLIKSGLSLSGALIDTKYLSSKSVTVRLSKRLKKHLDIRLEYKYYNYFYPGTNVTRIQNRIGGSANIAVGKKVYLSIYYEKTFQKYNTYSRLNFRATKRFSLKK